MGSSALVSGSAWARGLEAAPDEAVFVADVVVTAQKRDQPLIDVPISLRVLAGEEIRARQIRDMEGALDSIPNAAITRQRNTGSEWNIAIRGVSNAAALNVDGSVAVYIDDVFVPDSSGFNFEVYDLAALELLRGPQGTLYGRNATGGALNIRTQAPGTAFGGWLSAVYGSDDEVRLGGAVDLPTADGRLRTRIAGLYARHDGWIDNQAAGSKDVDSLDAYGLRFRSIYEASETTRIELAGDYAKTERLLGGGDMATVDDDGVNLLYPTDSRLKNGGASLKVDHQVGGVTVRSITAYRATRGISRGSRPEVILNDVDDANVDQHSWTQELQILSPQDRPLTWLAGAFGQRYAVERLSSLVNLDYGLGEYSQSRVKGTSLGVFAEARWAFAPRLALTVGGRYTHDDKRLHYAHSGSLAPLFGYPFAPAQALDDKRAWGAFTPQAVIEFLPSQGLRAYAKVSRGYKAGGFNTEFVALDNVSFGKESVWNYELGAKGRLLDGRAFLSAAIYRLDWDDQQVLNFFNGQSHVSNSDRSRSQGGEVELTLRPTPAFTLTGGFGYADAKFLRFPNADPYGNAADGNRQPRASKYSGSASAQYERALGQGWGGFARIDYSYLSSFYWDALNQLREPERHLVDASVGVSRGGLSARLFVKNATDRKYHLYAVNGTAGFFPAQATPADRRTFGLSIEQSF